jgi:hypothetical protein
MTPHAVERVLAPVLRRLLARNLRSDSRRLARLVDAAQ